MSTKEQRAEILKKLITPDIVSLLLRDRTTGENIIWATDDYSTECLGCLFDSPIDPIWVFGKNSLIKPRIEKDKDTQSQRSKNKAEVFTPTWVVLSQNNLVDRAWSGHEHLGLNFTKSIRGTDWKTNDDKIMFPKGKTWKEYVEAPRLEITCGEAPYLTTRYDAVTGDWIPVKKRVGLLDRKLRVTYENTDNASTFIVYAKKAVQAIYGFEWQGDSLYLARYNVLAAVIESYYEYYHKVLNPSTVAILADIISWNLIQMDGLKYVIPKTCHDIVQTDMFGVCGTESCPGCKRNEIYLHNGIYAQTMDWKKKQAIRFVDILKGEE